MVRWGYFPLQSNAQRALMASMMAGMSVGLIDRRPREQSQYLAYKYVPKCVHHQVASPQSFCQQVLPSFQVYSFPSCLDSYDQFMLLELILVYKSALARIYILTFASQQHSSQEKQKEGNCSSSSLKNLSSNTPCIIMINTCFYYYFTKLEKQKILTATLKESGKGFNLSLQVQTQENPSQLWMIKSADLENVYTIYHCSSGLCLEVIKDRTLELHHHKNKDAQKFKLNLLSSERMQCIISQYSKDAMVFVRDKEVVCDVKSGSDNVLWTLRRVRKHLSMQNSAILQMLTSGYVLDVADNAEYAGSTVYQSGWSGMFSQRWKFEKFKNFYLIRNAKSELVLTVKGKKSKEGGEIVQQKEVDTNHLHQLWSLEARAHQSYAIRLASDQELFLGVIKYANQNAEAMLTRKPEKNLWRIIGKFDL